MKKIGFLFYASHSWGMGHVYRIIDIMKLLKSKYQVIALTNDYKQTLMMLNENNILYDCIEKDNILLLSEKLQKLDLDILVVDKLDNTQEELEVIKEQVKYVVDLDDQGEGACFADLLINAIVPLPSKVPNQTYYGTNYMVFNKDTEKYASFDKLIQPNVSKLLVCFGE